VPGLRRAAQCGRDGGAAAGTEGVNLVCAGCGAEVATEESDCGQAWHDIRLDPTTVAPISV
jgi:hypothetical protein